MKPTLPLFAALAAFAALAPTVQAQVTIPGSLALPASSLDRSKPGFKVRVVQASTANGTLENSTGRAEAQIAGLLLQPDGTPYANIADLSSFNADGTYDEAGIIAYGAGTFPGIPGSEGHEENIAVEAITYLELTAKTYSMVVNSDDGFRVTVGDGRDRLREVVLGEYSGGRGAADTAFNFTVSQAGVYGFRLVYEEGGGDNKVDWYTADPADPTAQVHVNEAGGLTGYRALTSGTTLGPAIRAIQPLPDAINVPPSSGFTALIDDGTAPLNKASLKVFYNDTDVTSSAVVTSSGKTTKVTYTPTTLPEPLSKPKYKLVFDDPTITGGKREATLTYTVSAYVNITLPTPLWYEGFDGVEQGTLPAGWTTYSPIPESGEYDLDNPGSDAYLVWVVISKQRVQDLSARWDAARRLNYPEAYVNGKAITTLINTNFAYHESDIRGGSQYAELISPSINLTGKADVNLVYTSVYEQNPDNIAGVEYSIDDGKTWMPVVYMVDAADIVAKPDGTPDADATLKATQGDTAVYTDPNTGEEIGHSYGAFVKAPQAEWPNYNAYISGRINDDAKESKRVEKFRLPKADNQAKVRLRFFQAGTGSWYFGVDNVGLYSITTINPPTMAEQPKSVTRYVGTSASFSAKGSGEQLTYQWQKDSVDIPNANATTYAIANLTAADAGKYRVVIKNPGGQVTSDEATLTVSPLPTDLSGLKTALAVYLPFDGNFNDASGNHHDGTAMGSPENAAGLLGTGAVRVKSSRSAQAYNFVTLGSAAALPFGETKDFTVAYWMKTERVDGDPGIVATKNWGSGNNTGWSIGTQTDGRLEWNYRRAGDGLSRKDLDAAGMGLAATVWKHVVVAWGINGDAHSFVDGVEIDVRAISPGTGTLIPDGLSLNIGQDGTGAYTDGEWDGLIDDLAIWDRSLTAGEVAAIYTNGRNGTSLGNIGTSTPVTVSIAKNGSNVVITWTGSGKLQSASSVAGPYTEVAGAASPTTVPATAAAAFYRVAQ